MKKEHSFLAELKKLGVSLRVEGTRLLVDAPDGVVTAELRAKMARQKPELMSAIGLAGSVIHGDAVTARAVRTVARFLADAYPRRSPPGGVASAVLAFLAEPSVHEDVP